MAFTQPSGFAQTQKVEQPSKTTQLVSGGGNLAMAGGGAAMGAQAAGLAGAGVATAGLALIGAGLVAGALALFGAFDDDEDEQKAAPAQPLQPVQEPGNAVERRFNQQAEPAANKQGLKDALMALPQVDDQTRQQYGQPLLQAYMQAEAQDIVRRQGQRQQGIPQGKQVAFNQPQVAQPGRIA